MADVAKVIGHFQDAIEASGNNNKWRFVRTDIIQEAIELLKEQEPVKVRHLHGTKVTMHEDVVFTDECGNCNCYLLKHWKACPICGKVVKWDEQPLQHRWDACVPSE